MTYLGVVVSSTFTDLTVHRQAVMAAIEKCGLKAVGMEYSGANAEMDVLDTSLAMVRDGAAYIGLISHKYGQTPKDPERNPDDLSITELEFNEAIRLGRPILLFIMGVEHPVTVADIERDPAKQAKLNAFRERAKQMREGRAVNRVYEEFDSPTQLEVQAAIAVGRLAQLLRADCRPSSGPERLEGSLGSPDKKSGRPSPGRTLASSTRGRKPGNAKKPTPKSLGPRSEAPRSDHQTGDEGHSPSVSETIRFQHAEISALESLDSLLSSIGSTENLLSNPASGGAGELLNPAKIEIMHEIVAEEIAKLRRLETVIAVVGARGSGKSTIINAIVGRDLLPTGLLPTTVIPISVNHVSGLRQPSLRLTEKTRVQLQRMSDQIREAASNDRIRSLGLRKTMGPELRLIYDAILENSLGQIGIEYTAPDQIADTVRTVNGLVRLYGIVHSRVSSEEMLDIDPPTIHVEFQGLGLAQSKDELGKLSILDTPGPNEASLGDWLRPVVGSMLTKSSGVILVINFTQMQVDGEAMVRELITPHRRRIENRMFIFVNRCDEDKVKEWPEDRLREHVEGLVEDTVSQQRIFAIAASRAFLARWAEREYGSQGGRLPEPLRSGFSRAFLDEGRLSVDVQPSESEVRKTAQWLWRESGFADPLREVVARSVESAASTALRSGLARLDEFLDQVRTFLSLRNAFVTESAANLNEGIVLLSKHIYDLSIVRGRIEDLIRAARGDAATIVDQHRSKVLEDVGEIIEGYLRTGQIPSAGEPAARPDLASPRDSASIRNFRRFWSPISAILGAPTDEPDFLPPTEDHWRFEGPKSKSDAVALVQRVKARIELLSVALDQEITSVLNNAISELASDIETNTTRMIEETAVALKAYFNERFAVLLTLPTADFARELVEGEFPENLVKLGEEQIQHRIIQKNGRWARLVRKVLYADYGTQIHVETKNSAVVKLDALRRASDAMIKTILDQQSERVSDFINNRLSRSLNDYLGSVETYLAQVRNTIQKTLDERNMDSEQLRTLHGATSSLLAECDSLRSHVRQLRAGWDTFARPVSLQ